MRLTAVLIFWATAAIAAGDVTPVTTRGALMSHLYAQVAAACGCSGFTIDINDWTDLTKANWAIGWVAGTTPTQMNAGGAAMTAFDPTNSANQKAP